MYHMWGGLYREDDFPERSSKRVCGVSIRRGGGSGMFDAIFVIYYLPYALAYSLFCVGINHDQIS